MTLVVINFYNYELPSDEYDKEFNVRNNLERLEKEYWVDTNGKEYKYTKDDSLLGQIGSFHSLIARNILKDKKDPQTHLLKLGWIMVGSVVYKIPIIHKQPTQSQIDYLFDNNLLDSLGILDDGIYISWKTSQEAKSEI